MRAVVQRVRRASVTVGDRTVGEIGPGMLVLLGVAVGDGAEQADRIASKLARLRIFDDPEGRMNEPLGEREVLCVSQFTLLGDTSRGNRPGWAGAAAADVAEPLYERVCEALGAERGAFGADMVVSLENDGPVTLLLEA
jgi:D-tyrosyl-tRNA(Tyr) deacylase